MLDKEKTGRNIRKYMEKNKLSYDSLANYLNLKSSRVIYDWIAGLKHPSTNSLLKMSKLFNISINDMLE